MKRLLKRLLLLWFFSGSLDGFSQAAPKQGSPPKPDTLRCTLIVYYDRGPAILHTKPGFVVRGEREVYLDDKKRVIKAPLEVFSYKLKK